MQQLIQLNHELRESLASGWMAHKSGPSDGRFWPLMHLAIQVLRKHEALVLLAERGFGQEAGMMLRSMFEATVNAMWIAKDLDNWIKRYHAYQFFSAQKYRNLADKWGIKAKRTQTEYDKSLNLYLASTFEIANDCIGLGLEQQLDKAWAKLPEFLPESPDIMRGNID